MAGHRAQARPARRAGSPTELSPSLQPSLGTIATAGGQLQPPSPRSRLRPWGLHSERHSESLGVLACVAARPRSELGSESAAAPPLYRTPTDSDSLNS